MEAVLVTGGAGFIGSHLAEYLLNAGYNVVILDDLSGGFVENVEALWASDGSGKKRFPIFVRGSILNHELVNSLFAQYKFTYVYHLAAYAAEGLSHFIKRFNYHNNLVGSVNLIDAAVNYGTKCFVFTSSVAVYGSAQVPMLEEMTPAPEDSYGIAKAAVEQELAISQRLFGLDYVIFRPTQRDWPAPEYRRSIPECGGHFHEPASQRPSHAGVRGWGADTCVHLRRRHYAGDSRSAEDTGGDQPSVQHRRRDALHDK